MITECSAKITQNSEIPIIAFRKYINLMDIKEEKFK